MRVAGFWSVVLVLGAMFNCEEAFQFDSFQELRQALVQASAYDYATIPANPANKYSQAGNPLDMIMRLVVADVKDMHTQGLDVIVHLQSAWTDDRLSFNDTSATHNYTLAKALMPKVWTPGIYLEPEWGPPDFENSVIRMFPTGMVGTSVRFRATFPCIMKSMTIVDSDWTCTTKISSYAYDADELELSWITTDPILLEDGVTDRDPKILGVTRGVCQWDTFNELQSSCLQVDINVRKKFKSILVRMYVPNFMTCLMAWSSFWIHRDEVSARVKLGTLVVMTVMTEYVALEISVPEYLDTLPGSVWMMGCMGFDWLAFFLFVLVHVVRRREKARDKHLVSEKKEKEEEEKRTGQRAFSITANHPEGNFQSDLKGYSVWDGRQKVKCSLFLSSFQLDRLCRIWYGVSFLIFNLFFWIYFGVSSGHED